jgi:hypothetical protein
MELGIRLSFVKTSEFRGVGLWTPQTPAPLQYATVWEHQKDSIHKLKI